MREETERNSIHIEWMNEWKVLTSPDMFARKEIPFLVRVYLFEVQTDFEWADGRSR